MALGEPMSPTTDFQQGLAGRETSAPCGSYPTASSKQAFDRSRRNRNPNWSLRDIEVVAAMAHPAGFSKPVITAMPANNLSVVFRQV
jgi:hypothetical protein